MKIYICWSGETSRALAEIFKEWLPAVIQAVKPYYSPDDITKGSRWNTEISKELEASQIGLICLTKDNLEAPWVMFESGALSKNLDRSHVCPILFGVDPTDLKGPLVSFQASRFEKADIKKVVTMINKKLDTAGLSSTVLNSVFEKWWPDLEGKVKKVLSKTGKTKGNETRSERDLLEEILELSRDFSRKYSPSRLEEILTKERRLAFKRGSKIRRIPPVMVFDMARMTMIESGEPVGILLAISFLRDEAPWLYELGMEIYRKAISSSIKATREALLRFQRVAELTIHGPFAEELGMFSKESSMLMREMPMLIERLTEEYLETRRPSSSRKK